MSQLLRETPSDKTGGFEGNKSSSCNSKLNHRQELNKTFFRCENDLLDWFITNNYDNLLQLNPVQLFKQHVETGLRNYPFKSSLTSEVIFKIILAAHTKTKRVIESLYSAKAEKVGDL